MADECKLYINELSHTTTTNVFFSATYSLHNFSIKYVYKFKKMTAIIFLSSCSKCNVFNLTHLMSKYTELETSGN